MIFRFAALLAGLTVATASTKGRTSVRRLDGDGDGDGDGGEYDWMKGYNLMYENCFRGDSVATYRLCPAGNTCEQGCEYGAEYVVDLAFFIDAYTEAQLGAREYRCEMARENCDYDDEDQCYAAANLDYCYDANEDEDGFNLQEYIECTQISDDYYVGPYCSDNNYSIYLGVFDDKYCSNHVDIQNFYDVMGYELPYTAEAIITNECARCKEHGLEEDQNGGDDADDDDDVLEQCEALYEEASKCEGEAGIDNADDSGCDYIAELQQSEGVGSSNGVNTRRRRRRRAWGFIFLLIVLAAAGYLIYRFLLKREKKQQKKAAGEGDEDSKPSEEKLIGA